MQSLIIKTNVPIEGDEMKLRFIHAADLHLDSPFKGLQHLPKLVRERITRSTFVAYEKMIQFALDQKVDFVLIAGDVYDHSTRSLQAQLQFKQGLERLDSAQISCFVVHGNHDPLDGYKIPLEWPASTHFFSGDEVSRIPYMKGNQEVASIYGISYATSRTTDNLAKLFERKTDSFSIALLHTNCDSSSEHENYAPSTKKELLDAGFDYWALGHVHTRKILHHEPPIVYPGNSQGRHIREEGEKGFYLVEVDKFNHTTLSFQAIQDVIWIEKEIDFTNLTQLEEVLQLLEDTREQLRSSTPGTPIILRLKAVGQTSLAEVLIQSEVQDTLIEHWHSKEGHRKDFIWLESFHFKGEPSYDRNELKGGQGIFSDIINLADSWRDNNEERDRIVEKVLGDLLKHQRAKKILEPFSEEEMKELIQQAENIVLTQLMGGAKK
jgi:exonuclease SbcD